MTALFAEGSTSSLGQLLRRLRLERGLSQEELARGLCARSYISQLEKDLRYPSPTLLVKLARRLEVPLDHLLKAALSSPMVSFQHLSAWARHLLWVEGEGGERAIPLYQRMEELYRAGGRPSLWEAEMKEVLALFHYRGGEVQVARTLFDQAAEKGKGHPLLVARVRTGESLCLWHQGREEAALEELRDLWIAMALWRPTLRQGEEAKVWLGEVGTLLAFMEVQKGREAAALLVLELTERWAGKEAEDDLLPWRRFLQGRARLALGHLEKAKEVWVDWFSAWSRHELSPWARAYALEVFRRLGEDPPFLLGAGPLRGGDEPPPPRFLRGDGGGEV